jgi:heptosyltransferase-3
MRTLLVIHPGGLGDVLLSRPTLRALRRLYPSHQLGFVSGREVGGLLKASGEIDALFPLEYDTLGQLFAGHKFMAPAIREWLTSCDVAIAWTSDPDGVLRSTFAAFDIRRVVVQSAAARDPACEALTAGMHQSERLVRSLKSLGDAGVVKKETAKLSLPDTVLAEGAAHVFAIGRGRDPVALHPGSGSPHKCVSPELMAAIVRGLDAVGMAPVLIEGPADAPLVERLLQSCPIKPPIIRGLSLMRLAGVLAHFKLCVGHDSGLTHLAAALERPTVVLFGPTDPRRWAPRGPVKVLSGGPCQCGTWEEVRACRERICLQVNPDEVVAACRQIGPLTPPQTPPSRHLVLPERMC